MSGDRRVSKISIPRSREEASKIVIVGITFYELTSILKFRKGGIPEIRGSRSSSRSIGIKRIAQVSRPWTRNEQKWPFRKRRAPSGPTLARYAVDP